MEATEQYFRTVLSVFQYFKKWNLRFFKNINFRMKRAENSRYTVLKTNFIFTLFLGGFTVVNMAIAICLKLI